MDGLGRTQWLPNAWFLESRGTSDELKKTTLRNKFGIGVQLHCCSHHRVIWHTAEVQIALGLYNFLQHAGFSQNALFKFCEFLDDYWVCAKLHYFTIFENLQTFEKIRKNSLDLHTLVATVRSRTICTPASNFFLKRCSVLLRLPALVWQAAPIVSLLKTTTLEACWDHIITNIAQIEPWWCQ